MGEGAKRVTTLIGDNAGYARRAGSTAAPFNPSRALAALVAEQRDGWILWLAVAMIAGAALWLLWPVTPPAWLGPAVFVAGLALTIALRA